MVVKTHFVSGNFEGVYVRAGTVADPETCRYVLRVGSARDDGADTWHYLTSEQWANRPMRHHNPARRPPDAPCNDGGG